VSESGPPRWTYVLISLAIAIGTALLVYLFECNISG
jgi:hypothetical protein